MTEGDAGPAMQIRRPGANRLEIADDHVITLHRPPANISEEQKHFQALHGSPIADAALRPEGQFQAMSLIRRDIEPEIHLMLGATD